MRLKEHLEFLHSKLPEDNKRHFPPISEEKENPKTSRFESPATTYRYDASTSTSRKRTDSKFTPEKIPNVKLLALPLQECRYGIS